MSDHEGLSPDQEPPTQEFTAEGLLTRQQELAGMTDSAAELAIVDWINQYEQLKGVSEDQRTSEENATLADLEADLTDLAVNLKDHSKHHAAQAWGGAEAPEYTEYKLKLPNDPDGRWHSRVMRAEHVGDRLEAWQKDREREIDTAEKARVAAAEDLGKKAVADATAEADEPDKEALPDLKALAKEVAEATKLVAAGKLDPDSPKAKRLLAAAEHIKTHTEHRTIRDWDGDITAIVTVYTVKTKRESGAKPVWEPVSEEDEPTAKALLDFEDALGKKPNPSPAGGPPVMAGGGNGPAGGPPMAGGNLLATPQEKLPPTQWALTQLDNELTNIPVSLKRIRELREILERSIEKNADDDWIQVDEHGKHPFEGDLPQSALDDVRVDTVNKLVDALLEKTKPEYWLLEGEEYTKAEAIMGAQRLDFSLTSPADEAARLAKALATQATTGQPSTYRPPVGAGEIKINENLSRTIMAARQAAAQDRQRWMDNAKNLNANYRPFRKRTIPEAVRTHDEDGNYLDEEAFIKQLQGRERRTYERAKAHLLAQEARTAESAHTRAQMNGAEGEWQKNLRHDLSDELYRKYSGFYVVNAKERVSDADRATILRWGQLRTLSRMSLHNEAYAELVALKSVYGSSQPEWLAAYDTTTMQPFDNPELTLAASLVPDADAGNAVLEYTHQIVDNAAFAENVLENMKGLSKDGVESPNFAKLQAKAKVGGRLTPAEATELRLHQEWRMWNLELSAIREGARRRIENLIGHPMDPVNGVYLNDNIRQQFPPWFSRELVANKRRLPAGTKMPEQQPRQQRPPKQKGRGQR